MPKKIEDTTLEEKSLIATAEEYDTVAYGEKLKLTDSEQKDIINDIVVAVGEFKTQRGEEGIEEEWQNALDLHNGDTADIESDYPYEDFPKLHIHITGMTDDILAEKLRKRTLVRPMMLARAKPQLQNVDKFVVSKKEKFIADKTFGEMALEENQSPIIEDAIKLGTGIGKLCHIREIQNKRTLEVYEPTIKDIERFVEDFANNKNDVYRENISTLKKNLAEGIKESISVWVEKEEVIKFQPKLSWVDPFNLYLDYYITDLRYHRVIAEKIPDIGWEELNSYFDSGYFDKENDNILEDLKKKYPKEEYTKKKYTLWECNYKFKYKKNYIRSIVTYIEELPTKLAKSISFPYLMDTPNYYIYKIINKRNSIYGTGIPIKLKDTNLAVNHIWNLNIAAAEFTIAPMMVANVSSTNFDPTSKKFGPATIWWLGANDKIVPLDNAHNLQDSYKLLEYLHRYAEWISGVSAYMSGRESPIDPNAPASKAYMLLQESNLRINSYIRKIDQTNIKLFEAIDSLYFQFYNDSVKYYEESTDSGYISKEISRKELGTPVNWIPQLSDITINKALEKEENFKMAAFLLSQQMVVRLPKAQRRIIEIVLRSQGGEWEKAIEDLIPDAKETDIVSKIMELVQQVGPQQIMDIMASMLQGATPPQAGGNVPQMGAPGEAINVNPMTNLEGKVPNV